jgi:hypothetical protein
MMRTKTFLQLIFFVISQSATAETINIQNEFPKNGPDAIIINANNTDNIEWLKQGDKVPANSIVKFPVMYEQGQWNVSGLAQFRIKCPNQKKIYNYFTLTTHVISELEEPIPVLDVGSIGVTPGGAQCIYISNEGKNNLHYADDLFGEGYITIIISPEPISPLLSIAGSNQNINVITICVF